VKLKLTASATGAAGRSRDAAGHRPLGVTPPLAVTVGQFPATDDKEAQQHARAGDPANFPTSIVGRIEVGGDVDSFRFDAKKDQHLVFDLTQAGLAPRSTPSSSSSTPPPRAAQDTGFHAATRRSSYPSLRWAYVMQTATSQYRGGGE